MSEDIKTIALQLIDIWNTRQLDFLDEVIDSSYVDEVLAEGKRAVLRWQAAGTHTGDLQGIAATSKATSGLGMSILHFRNGKVTEDYCIWDALGMLRRIGVIPAAGDGPGSIVFFAIPSPLAPLARVVIHYAGLYRRIHSG